MFVIQKIAQTKEAFSRFGHFGKDAFDLPALCFWTVAQGRVDALNKGCTQLIWTVEPVNIGVSFVKKAKK